jgi:hypothetical protein
MKALKLLLTYIFLFSGISANAQVKQPPAQVRQAFEKMFPTAVKAVWKEMSDHFTVFFSLPGKNCEAKFTSGGDLLSTQMPFPLDSLPLPVADSLKAGAYSDWAPISAYVFSFAKDPTQYHLVMTKAGQGRKILLFNSRGHLIAVR